jgi:histidinol dehydrogenase/sulfopropanediol 3-dehydrogenase
MNYAKGEKGMQTTYLKKAKPVQEADVKALRQGVEEIIDTVRKDGDGALAHYAKTFDDFEGPMRVGEAEFEAAKKELPPKIIEGLDFAIERVTAFAESQRAQITEFEQEMIPGVWMGHRLVPVDSCAAYVPAGRYPCLTSAVMSLVPAKVAGVKRLVACSSPGKEKRINPAILYTMVKIGADEIYCLGGAQAIAGGSRQPVGHGGQAAGIWNRGH